jgi:peroxiredoxin
MSEERTNDRTEWTGPVSSRRAVLWLAVPVVLVAGYFAVMQTIRSHVDGLIQASVGKPLPAFALRDRTGREWKAEDLLGKPALLHFFRSRCESCEAEAPELRQLEVELEPEGIVLLHVMTDAVLGFPPEETAATAARKEFKRPILIADAAFVDAFHRVKWSQVTPITYVVDPQGVVRFGLRGKQTAATVRAALAAAK